MQGMAGLVALTLVVGGGNLWASWTEGQGVQHSSASACRFFADLAGLPVTVTPTTKKASLLGVQIVADSRLAWRGLGCPGTLAPPAPSFEQWARYYHLPYR